MSGPDNHHLKRYEGFDRRRQLYKLDHEAAAPSLLKMVEREISDRAIRKKVMRLELINDHIWDILLHLFASRYKKTDISSTTLAHTVEVPVTTALRYINYLESEFLVEKYGTDDHRVTAVRLTSTGFERMAEYMVQKVIASP